MPNPRSSRRRRLARTQPDRSLVRTALASATAAALLLCAVPAPDAHANSYDIYACYAGQGTYLNPGNSAASWTMADNNGTAYYLPYDQCGSDGPNGFGVISRSGYTAPTGDYGEVLFQAPPGLHIRQVQLWRSLIDYGIGAGGTSQRNYAWNLADGQLPGVGDEYDGSADVPYGAVGSGDTTDNGIVTSNYTSVNLASALPGQYAYVVGCAFYNGCPTGGQNPLVPSGFDTVLDIYGAIVSIEDDIPPTLSLADSGLLDGQPQSGTVPLTITASATAGIASLAVFTAGSQTPAFSEDFTQTSSCQFWEAVPCQNLDSYQYPVDTTKLPNGTYYITVKASDPAGNVTSASSPSPVTIDNPQPAATAAPRCPTERLSVSLDGGRASLRTRYGRVVRLAGVLLCGEEPLASAAVKIAGDGISASAMTNAAGAFTYLIPSGPSRRLSITAGAGAGTAPAAAASATIAVRPSMTLAISPRRTSNGGTILWRGAVKGGPYPPQGLPLLVEVKEGGRWQAFDEILAHAGRVAYRYTFRRTTTPTTYRFRVALPTGGAVGYPYSFAASNAVSVHVG